MTALSDENIQRHVAGREIRKVIQCAGAAGEYRDIETHYRILGLRVPGTFEVPGTLHWYQRTIED
jgi:hypothetical protein